MPLSVARIQANTQKRDCNEMREKNDRLLFFFCAIDMLFYGLTFLLQQYVILTSCYAVFWYRCGHLPHAFFSEFDLPLTTGEIIKSEVRYWDDTSLNVRGRCGINKIFRVIYNEARDCYVVVSELTKCHSKGRHAHYLRLSALHEFGGLRDLHLSAADGETMDWSRDYGSTWYEASLGGTCRLDDRTTLYGDLQRTFGSDWHKKWQGNIGLNWQF